MMEYLLVLIIALVLDVAFGELPNAIHPVAWLGRIISWQLKLCPEGNKPQLLYGTIIVLGTMAVFSVPLFFLMTYLRDVNTSAFIITGAMLLKFTFSLRELHRAAIRVKSPLEEGDLPEARNQLGRIVSRKTETLGEEAVVAAVVESVSENTSDSFVAPLFYFLILGIPGAIAYRVCNTFDAMIGYHGEYEYLGRFAAKLDDVLNFLPARLSGLIAVLVAKLAKGSLTRAWHVMWRDHGKTESPNAGWTMAATAGALGIRLEKEGHYSLGDTVLPISAEAINQGMKIMWLSAGTWVIICLGVTLIVFT